MLKFSERLKELRNEKGMSQQYLANLLHVHQTTVKDWETRGKEPKYEVLIKLSEIFGVTVGQLLGVEDY